MTNDLVPRAGRNTKGQFLAGNRWSPGRKVGSKGKLSRTSSVSLSVLVYPPVLPLKRTTYPTTCAGAISSRYLLRASALFLTAACLPLRLARPPMVRPCAAPTLLWQSH